MKHFLRPLIVLVAFLLCDFCLNAQTVMTVGYTGSVSTFTVPRCVNSITVNAHRIIVAGGGGLNANLSGEPVKIVNNK